MSRGERAECLGVERELVEVVLDGLDLAVVADLVAEAEEDVLDLAADLRDRVEVAERQLLARERDVDDLLAQARLELGALELARSRSATAASSRSRSAFSSIRSRGRGRPRSACASSLLRPR